MPLTPYTFRELAAAAKLLGEPSLNWREEFLRLYNRLTAENDTLRRAMRSQTIKHQQERNELRDAVEKLQSLPIASKAVAEELQLLTGDGIIIEEKYHSLATCCGKKVVTHHEWRIWSSVMNNSATGSTLYATKEMFLTMWQQYCEPFAADALTPEQNTTDAPAVAPDDNSDLAF